MKEQVIYPWGRIVRRTLEVLSPYPFSGDTVYISSDYGGTQRASDYDTISVLYADLANSREWEVRRREIRRRFLQDGRRMCYKSLNDKCRQAALVPFLAAANHLRGVVLTLAIRKSITDLCWADKFRAHAQELLQLDPDWKTHVLERLLRVVHLVSLIIGTLSRPHQNIYWISDQDELFANERRSMDLKKILDRFASYYVQHPLGEIGFGTTAIDESDRADEDLNSIPDLLAGAVADVSTRLASCCGGFIPGTVAIPFQQPVRAKTEIIWSWLEDKSQTLRRGVIIVDRQPNGRVAGFKLDSE